MKPVFRVPDIFKRNQKHKIAKSKIYDTIRQHEKNKRKGKSQNKG